MVDACLSPVEIERLARGGLRGGARTRAEGHLDRCHSCRTRLEAQRPSAPPTTVTAMPHAARERPQPREDRPDDDAIEGFRLLEEIHRGGQGVVWRALDESRGEIVALKILREGPFATSDQKMRFDRESELARGLDHPLIVAPLQSGVSRGRPYHVLKFVEGLTLDAWARETQPSLRRILEVFRDACDAVAHAHAHGVVHRDLKPANVLVDARGKPHVVDFGVAKSSLPGQALPLTVTGEFVGTLSHASPEQAQGDPRLIDERTDVYALGVILYELITGRMPYPVTGAPADVLRNVIHAEPKNPTSIDPSIDEQLSAIVLKALAKEPGQRYGSVGALRDDVDAYLEGMPVRARPAGAWDLLARTARRNKRGFVVAAIFAAVLGAVALFASIQAARLQHQTEVAKAAEAKALAHAQELEKARAEARRETHAASVAAASLAIRAGQLGEARRRLAQSPEEWRGWEWAHLSLATDAAEAHRDADGAETIALGVLADGHAWRATRQRLEILDSRTLETVSTRPLPDVPKPDEGASAEIVSVAQDASLAALRWDDATWTRLGAPGRALLVADFSGRIQAILHGAAWRPDRAVFSPDARRLAATTSASYDADPRVWSTLTGGGRRVPLPAGAGSGAAAPLAFSPDGALLAAGGADGRVRASDAEAGSGAWESEALPAAVESLAWSAGGFLAARAGSVIAVLAADGSTSSRIALPAGTPHGVVAIDRGGRRVALGTDDGDVMAWEVATGRLLLEARGHERPVTALAFAGENETLVSAARDGSLQRWRAEAGAGPAPLLPLEAARAVAFSQDGVLVAAASSSGVLRVFDAADGHAILEAADSEGGLGAIAFSDDGTRLVTAGLDASGAPRSVRVRLVSDPASETTLGSVPGVTDLACRNGVVVALGSPGVLAAWRWDGTPLAAAEIFPSPARLGAVAADPFGVEIAWTDGTTRRWSSGSEPWSTLDAGCAEAVSAPTGAVAWLRDDSESSLAVAAQDAIVSCSGTGGGLVRRAEMAATALAWSPDGSRLFAGDARGALTVLAPDPLEPLLTLPATDGAVVDLAVSPDGKLVAAAGPNGVRLFRSR